MDTRYEGSRDLRPSEDDYFMGIALAAAARSTCDRAKVGAVLVKAGHIAGTGYNGSPKKQPHCDDVGHLLVGGHCVRTIHAEQNAIMFSRTGTEGSTCYVTHYPCLICANLLVNAGIDRIVYADAYRVDRLSVDVMQMAGIEEVQWSKSV